MFVLAYAMLMFELQRLEKTKVKVIVDDNKEDEIE